MQVAYLPELLSASGSTDMPRLVVPGAFVARGWGPLCFLYPFARLGHSPVLNYSNDLAGLHS